MSARLCCVYPGLTGGSKHCQRPCFICRALVFVCLFCGVASSWIILSHHCSTPPPLPTLFLVLCYRAPHTCENLARFPFLFFDVCLEMSFYLVQLTNWDVYKHTYTWTYRESSSKITENLGYSLFFFPPPPVLMMTPCVLVSSPLLSPILVLQNPCRHSLLANF